MLRPLILRDAESRNVLACARNPAAGVSYPVGAACALS